MLNVRCAKRTKLGRFLCRLLGDQRGAVAMEYVMIALLVAAAVIGVVMIFGKRIGNMFSTSTKALSATEGQIQEVATEASEQRTKDYEAVDPMRDAGHDIRGTEGGEQ